MELTKIEALLKKYEEGTTTLAEEEQLRAYFAAQNVRGHLQGYKALFSFTSEAKNITYSGNQVSPSNRRKKQYSVAGLAASILLIISLVTYFNYNKSSLSTNELGTVQNPKEAYFQAKQTLNMISNVLNNGKEDLVYIKEFNNTKNKFIKEQ